MKKWLGMFISAVLIAASATTSFAQAVESDPDLPTGIGGEVDKEAYLRARSAFEAHGEVPGRVARRGGPLWSCTGCGQWFWLGSHTDRLRGWFEGALGRAIEWPEIPPREEGRKPHLDR